jgi:hypothetical protein
MSKPLTDVNITMAIMAKGSPANRAFLHYIAAPGERRFDALVRVTLVDMGYSRGPEGSAFKIIPASDYERAAPVIEEVVSKLKRRTIARGLAIDGPGEATAESPSRGWARA